jgi:hypothetical protein
LQTVATIILRKILPSTLVYWRKQLFIDRFDDSLAFFSIRWQILRFIDDFRDLLAYSTIYWQKLRPRRFSGASVRVFPLNNFRFIAFRKIKLAPGIAKIGVFFDDS